MMRQILELLEIIKSEKVLFEIYLFIERKITKR